MQRIDWINTLISAGFLLLLIVSDTQFTAAQPPAPKLPKPLPLSAASEGSRSQSPKPTPPAESQSSATPQAADRGRTTTTTSGSRPANPSSTEYPAIRSQSEKIKNAVNKILEGGDDSDEAYLDDETLPELDPNRWPISLINSSSYWSLDPTIVQPAGMIKNVDEARFWLDGYLLEANQIFHVAAESGWNYFTNLTDYNRQVLVDSELVRSLLPKQARQFDPVALQANATLQRLIQMLSLEGLPALPEDKFNMLNDEQREILRVFTEGAVCERNRPPPCTLNYPAVEGLMATSRDPSELLYAWLSWRDAVGPLMKDNYTQMVRLSNEGAKLNGFTDAGQLWRSPYEENSGIGLGLQQQQSDQETETAAQEGGPLIDLRRELDRVYKEIQPLYQQLHAYVRRRTAEIYAPVSLRTMKKDGPIPAYMLGSMTGESWLPLYEDTLPFPELLPPPPSTGVIDPEKGPSSPFDDYGGDYYDGEESDPVSDGLLTNGYDARRMFKDGENLFQSLGLPPLEPTFWNESLIEHPGNRNVFCHPPTAFDLKNGQDYRVKICTQVNQVDYAEAHRLLAHTMYQRAYRSLPITFREGANPSFGQAVADAFGTIAQSKPYLKAVGLMTKDAGQKAAGDQEQPSPEPEPTAETEEEGTHRYTKEQKADINALYEEALDHLVYGPFSIVVDFWRWSVYKGDVSPENYNSEWWKLIRKYQGVSEPEPREVAQFFDPGACPQIASQQFPAVRRFLSYILQFQLLKGLCKAAGFEGPLNMKECNLIGSTNAGSQLMKLMEVGTSKPWPNALESATGMSRISGEGLMEYYAPLMDFLRESNEKDGEYIGWDGPGESFPAEIAEVFHGNTVAEELERDGQIAFPDEDCSQKQICIMDSECNGTVCVCKENYSLFKASEGSSFCFEGDPEIPDYGVGAGGRLFIDGTAATTTEDEEDQAADTASSRGNKFSKSSSASTPSSFTAVAFSISLLLLLFSYFSSSS